MTQSGEEQLPINSHAGTTFPSVATTNPQFSNVLTHNSQGRLFRRGQEDSLDECWNKFQTLNKRQEDSFRIDDKELDR